MIIYSKIAKIKIIILSFYFSNMKRKIFTLLYRIFLNFNHLSAVWLPPEKLDLQNHNHNQNPHPFSKSNENYLQDHLKREMEHILQIPWPLIQSERKCHSKYSKDESHPVAILKSTMVCHCELPTDWQILEEIEEHMHWESRHGDEIFSTLKLPMVPKEVGENEGFDCTRELQMCAIFNGYDIFRDWAELKSYIIDTGHRTHNETRRCAARNFNLRNNFKGIWSFFR